MAELALMTFKGTPWRASSIGVRVTELALVASPTERQVPSTFCETVPSASFATHLPDFHRVIDELVGGFTAALALLDGKCGGQPTSVARPCTQHRASRRSP